MLSKIGAKFKIESSMMSPEIASIWISVGGSGKKSTIIGGYYREFTIIHDLAPADSGNLSSQKKRLKSFTNQWRQAANADSCWVRAR